MNRRTATHHEMVTVRTAPDPTNKMVEVYFEADGSEMLAGSISPNLLSGMGMPIDVDAPKTWASTMRVSKKFLERIANKR